MDSTLSFGSLAALFSAMLVLAAVPSTSVLIVTARAAAHGFAHGAWVSGGVVVGDLIFIALAIIGLAALVQWLGPAFVVIKVIGALYLVWMGAALWRSRSIVARSGAAESASMVGSFTSGLMLTLGDQKAVMFYLGFLPAFIHFGQLSAWDIALVMLIAAVAVGGVKLAYAGLAARTGRLFGGGATRGLNRLAGMVVTVVGLFLLVTVVIDAQG